MLIALGIRLKIKGILQRAILFGPNESKRGVRFLYKFGMASVFIKGTKNV